MSYLELRVKMTDETGTHRFYCYFQAYEQELVESWQEISLDLNRIATVYGNVDIVYEIISMS